MIQPIGNRLLIKPDTLKAKSKSGIIISESKEKETPSQGEIISLGSPTIDESLKVGCKVIFKKYEAETVLEDEIEYLVVDEGSILAVLE